MPQSFYRELTKILQEKGIYHYRAGNGSHEIWRTPDGKTFAVPYNCYSAHTANDILKKAGLRKRF